MIASVSRSPDNKLLVSERYTLWEQVQGTRFSPSDHYVRVADL
jgi:hypothetical protein